MKPHADDIGLAWQVYMKPRAERGPVPVRLGPLPDSDWLPPTELPSLRGVKKLCIDTENRDEQLAELGPGCRRADCYIVGLAVGTDDGRRLYLPTRHEGGGNMDADLVYRWAQDELNNYDGDIVGAQLVYDLDWLAQPPFNVTFPKVKHFYDVQIAEPIIDEWKLRYSLDSLSEEYLGEGKEETLLKAAARAMGIGTSQKAIKKNIWKMHSKFVGPYGEGDVDRPLRILPLQIEKLIADGQYHIFELESRLIPMLLAMRRRGVRIDLPRAETVRAKLIKERDTLLAKMRHLSSPKAEFMAVDSFVQALIDRGLQVPRTEPSPSFPNGQLSVARAFLERNRGDELVATILAGRKLNTTINTFIEGHILGHHVNGRIHCTFNQLKGEDEDGKRRGTIARYSSDNPNLQNIPAREDKETTSLTGINIPLELRALFIPEDGQRWERLDESQVEYRFLANFARGEGAEECRQAYINDPKTDYHELVGQFLGVDAKDATMRKRVKNTNFAKTYGAMVGQLAITFNCTLQEAKDFVELYETKLPFAKTTFDAASRWAMKRGYVETILLRKQRFPLWEPAGNFGKKKKPAFPRERALAVYGPGIVRANAYTALNRKLQASAADLMKKAMADSWDAGCYNEIGPPLLTVHDELDLDVPLTASAEQAMREITHHMETAIILKVPLICDRSHGKNWGEAS